MGFSFNQRQRQWLVLVLLVSLLLPITFATLLVGVANVLGCQMVSKTADLCIIQGVNISQIIKNLVDWNWAILGLRNLQIPILSIGLFIGLLVLTYTSFRGWNRILIGCFSIWYIWFTPLITGFGFVMYLVSQSQCLVSVQGVIESCYFLGLDMGVTVRTAGESPWLILTLFPI